MRHLRRYPAVMVTSTALLFVALGALVWTAAADARKRGSLVEPGFHGCKNCDGFQAKTGPGSPKYRVPRGPTGLWTINAWSTQGGTSDGAARIRIYRRTSTRGQFELVGQSALETVPANQHPLFATGLDVQKGDLLGLHTEFGVPEDYPTTFTGDLVKNTVLCQPDGVGGLVGAETSCPLADAPDHLVNVLAKLTPR